MNGSAEAVGKTADVDGKALPGSELAKRANEANAADETPDGRQPQPQQRQLYHKGSQRNENAKRNIPSAHGVPLEGEWSVCASGRVRDSKSDSRGGGMGKRTSVDEWSWPVETPRPTVRIPKGYCQLGRADSASCEETSVDSQGESGRLVPTTVELVDPGGSEKPRMCLGGTKMRIGKVESHGCQPDKSRGQANESRGQVDALTVLNTCKTVAMGNGDGTGTRSDAGGASCDGVGPNGHANRSDVSSGHMDVPGICNGTNMTADTTETISTYQNAPQMQNSPVNAGRRDQVESRSCVGMPNMRVDTHGVAIHTNTAGDMQRHVSTGSENAKSLDLPTGSTRLHQDGTDRLESCPGMQTAHVHAQDIGKKSNKPANMSVMRDFISL